MCEKTVALVEGWVPLCFRYGGGCGGVGVCAVYAFNGTAKSKRGHHKTLFLVLFSFKVNKTYHCEEAQTHGIPKRRENGHEERRTLGEEPQ